MVEVFMKIILFLWGFLLLVMLPVYFVRKKRNPEDSKNKFPGLLWKSLLVCTGFALLPGAGLIAMYIDDQKEDTEEYTEMKAEVITAQAAKEIMDGTEEYTILDVREPDEFAEGHIEGAVQLSYTEIADKAEGTLPDKDGLILVYCRSGRRSAIAAETLVKMGYTNVKDFGGIIDWPYEVVK